MTAVVIGGGIAGLVAARRLALTTAERIVLLEAGPDPGGRVSSVPLDGALLDGGAESFAVRGGTVRTLLADLGLAADVVDPQGSAWVALPDRTVPLPVGGLLGIPSSPLATDVRRVVDAGGSLRAYADRLMPVLKVGRYPTLGPLVRGRMGERVLDRLVAPVVENVYGVHPDDVPVDAVAPGLNAAITATGALSAAVLQLRTAAPPGSAAQGLAGGVHRLVDALLAALSAGGVEVRTSVPVTGLSARQDGGFRVGTASGDLVADRVVLAVDGAAALDLLRTVAPQLAAMARPAPVVSRSVLLSLDDARLDAAPRGTGVLRSRLRTDVRATALTHASAKWPWLRALLPAHRHVLRVAYRGEEAVEDDLVLADAAALLGFVPAPPRDRRDVLWRDTAPPLAPETLAVRRALTDAVLPRGLAVAGAWSAGTGLAAVVASAERAAASV